jgi:single-stranded-DNA-specific exonuclease
MKHRWRLAPAQPQLSARLAGELGVSPLLAQCLLNRGLDESGRADAFLKPQLRQLADPHELPNLTRAVERLWLARQRQESVVIFGDYDVDGVTATALLLEVLRPLGWRVECYLPHRLEEGYGLTRDAVENCLQRHPAGLLVTVDCGSTAGATIAWLRERGIEVVVLDHHQVAASEPAAFALVNPQLGPAGPAGFRELSSVGLAFKLAHALVKRGRELGEPPAQRFELKPLLDLVALGAIADLAPLTGENRVLVSAGLHRMNIAPRIAVRALKSVAQISEPIGTYEVAFQLAPRLNAVGRLENAAQALELLLSQDPAHAQALAESLNALNRERQSIERAIAEEVINELRSRFNPATDYVLVEGRLLWHVGVVGIVASRVVQEFYRPTIILGGDGHEWRGSGRSIEGFDLAEALRACADLLVRHGGHTMAAGLTVHPENVAALRERLNALARQRLTPGQLQPVLRLDAEASLAELTLDRLRELDRLQPFGQANPPVQLVVRKLTLRRPPARIGRELQHLKLWVTDGQAAGEVLWWNGADQPCPQGEFDLACAPQLNEFNDRLSVQLRLLGWRPTQPESSMA